LQRRSCARADGGSLFDLENDAAPLIFDARLANATAYKCEEIAKELLAGVKRRGQKPSGSSKRVGELARERDATGADIVARLAHHDSGSVTTVRSSITRPLSSRMHTLVPSRDTSNPTYSLIAALPGA